MRTRYVGAFGTSITLHLAVLVILTWAGFAPAGETAPRAEPDGPVISLVSPDDLAPRKPPEPELRPESTAAAAAAAPTNLGIAIADEDAELKFPAFTFDFRKIVTRASTLFPFLSRDFVREPLARTPQERRADTPLVNPFNRFAHGRPPLLLDDAALQAIVDESWSRRQRWGAFQTIAIVAVNYDADAGRLPDLFRQYVTQNGLQPYDDRGMRDPRLWAQLGLVADHSDFLDFIDRYAAVHPSTRATTELLFLAEKLAQASSDTLLTMIEIDPARDLRWTQVNHRAAYEAIVTIRGHYRTELEKRAVIESDEVRERFAQVRIAILENILRTTPHEYRVNDARFLIGAIHWQQGRHEDALRAWHDLRLVRGDGYTAAIAELLAELRTAEGGLPALDRVRRVLESEHGRWLARAYDRLHRFGYRFDTF